MTRPQRIGLAIIALLVLGHPTLIILARTAMADVPQAAAALGGWWLCKRNRPLGTIACLAILVSLKRGCQSRHSSVVEHVIGNDGVDCSIQSGGTTFSRT